MIPDELKASLDRYAKHRIPTGGFLSAVLANDLQEAVRRADHNNRHRLLDICDYVYSGLPADCWGSADKVNNWIKRGAS